MSRTVNSGDFVTAIMDELATYSHIVDDTLQDEIDKLSNDVVKWMKNNPKIPERTGAYKKSFRIKKIAQGIGYKRNIIYNKLHQLTHLLERPHLNRDGTSYSKAFPHWEDAQKIVNELPERFEKRLEEIK